ncbi:MAG: ABC transporter permease [Gemmatimonadota bacterium]|nr:ABC transporter permease [Gemmatimonadota bacterium]
MRPPAAVRGMALALGAVGVGLLVLALGLAASGYDAPAALAALFRGGFGSADAILSGLLPRAVPLILIGLGIGLAFRAGALNIGAEGQFYAGAIVATWIGLMLGAWPRPLAVPAVLVAGVVAGMLWVLAPAVLRLRFGVLEVITTLLLNFVSEALVSWMVQGPLQEATGVYPQSDPLPLSARLPQLGGTRLHAGIALVLLLAGALWVFLRYTLAGFRLRATGAGLGAARVVGRVRTGRVFGGALLASGGCAGLAGAMEVSGTTFSLFQNLSPGYGFTGIAVALLARLDPVATVGTGLLIAGLQAGSSAMQRDAGVPAVAVRVVEAAVIIVVLLADLARRRADRDRTS